MQLKIALATLHSPVSCVKALVHSSSIARSVRYVMKLFNIHGVHFIHGKMTDDGDSPTRRMAGRATHLWRWLYSTAKACVITPRNMLISRPGVGVGQGRGGRRGIME